MEAISTEAQHYLHELCRRVQGDAAAQVSMFDVGAAMGLEKEAARKLAEDLIAEGLVEIKTLSGGIGITAQGIDRVQPAGGQASDAGLDLGSGPVLGEKGRKALERIVTEVRCQLASQPIPYARLEEMVVDIKTIDLQLFSPRPKIGVIKEVLRSLQDGLENSGAVVLAGKLGKMIGV
jgi:hypothetical protein